jgi:metallophosphoesterase superfamily enzyme
MGLGASAAGYKRNNSLHEEDRMDPKKIERVLTGIHKSRQQEARRAVVKERLEDNARDERRQFIVMPAMHILDQGKRP